MLRFSVLLLLLSTILAFQAPPAVRKLSQSSVGKPFVSRSLERPFYLHLFNKNKETPEKNKQSPVKRQSEKQAWDFQLFLTYMTPWKNPNSLFVYLFAAVYFLGKLSEARLAAGQ